MGVIRPFAGSFAPRGWMLCQGQLLQISDYTTLYTIIGTTYGGDGQTTFALPDLRSRVAVGGFGHTSPGLNAIDLGEDGGFETISLTSGQMPVHNHTMMVSDTVSTIKEPTPNTVLGITGDDSTGTFIANNSYGTANPDTVLNQLTILDNSGSMPHSNIQPSLALNYVMCVEGYYPSRN